MSDPLCTPHRPVQALPLCLGCCQSASVGLPAPPLHVPGGPLNPPLLKIFRRVTPHVERNPTLYPAHRTLTPYVLSPQVLPTALLAAGEYARPLLLRCPPTPPERLPRAAPHSSEGHSWPPAGLFTATRASSSPLPPSHTHSSQHLPVLVGTYFSLVLDGRLREWRLCGVTRRAPAARAAPDTCPDTQGRN